MIFFIILTADKYRKTYLQVSGPAKSKEGLHIPNGDITLVLLEHLSDLLGLFNALLSLGSGSNRLLKEDVSIGEKLIKLNFDIVVSLKTTSELRGSSNKDGPDLSACVPLKEG
jgi:hypothetical protein